MLYYQLPSTWNFPPHSASLNCHAVHVESYLWICILFFSSAKSMSLYILLSILCPLHITCIHFGLNFAKHGPKCWRYKDTQSLLLRLSHSVRRAASTVMRTRVQVHRGVGDRESGFRWVRQVVRQVSWERECVRWVLKGEEKIRHCVTSVGTRPSLRKDPCFGLVFQCHHLETHSSFWTRSSVFSFCIGLYRLCG